MAGNNDAYGAENDSIALTLSFSDWGYPLPAETTRQVDNRDCFQTAWRRGHPGGHCYPLRAFGSLNAEG